MRRLKRGGPKPYDAKYYGPGYNSRADDRSPDRTQYDDYGGSKPAEGRPRKGGKVKTVLRDPADYEGKKKRAKRS